MSARPPRVLVIAPTPFFADRGCHVRIYEEVVLLRDLGYRVEVCTYHLGRDLEGVTTRRSLRIPWYRKLGPGPSWHKLYLDVLLLFTCARSILHERPALLHAHLHEGAALGAVLGKLFGVPCVADLQGSLTKELADYGFAGGNRVLYALLRVVERWIDRGVDQLVVSSEPMRDDLMRRFGVPWSRITVIRDGVGHGFLETPQPHRRERYGIPEEHEIVVYLGVLTRLQGMEILVDAIPRVLRDRPDTTFLVIGFPHEARWAEEVRRRGCARNVVFTGRMDYLSVSRALAMADVAISPKISETEGNGKLFHYMASGLPVVVFESDVNREILGDHGIFVEARTAEAYAAAVTEALAAGERSRELGKRLRERARERASWEANRPAMRSVYERMRPERGGRG